jgi:hypothetical protein
MDDFEEFKEHLERSGASNAYCPKNKGYKIAGNYLADNYQFITVKLKK